MWFIKSQKVAWRMVLAFSCWSQTYHTIQTTVPILETKTASQSATSMQRHAKWSPSICLSMCEQEYTLTFACCNSEKEGETVWCVSDTHLADASKGWHRIKTISNNSNNAIHESSSWWARYIQSTIHLKESYKRAGVRSAYNCCTGVLHLWGCGRGACMFLFWMSMQLTSTQSDKTVASQNMSVVESLTWVQHVVARPIFQEHREDGLKQVLFHYAPAAHQNAVLASKHAESLNQTQDWCSHCSVQSAKVPEACRVL